MTVDHEISISPLGPSGCSIQMSLSGDFYPSTSDELFESFCRPDVTAASQIQVDLTGVSFIESSTFHALAVSCWAKRKVGSTFSVRCGDGMARRILDVLGLTEYFMTEIVWSPAA